MCDYHGCTCIFQELLQTKTYFQVYFPFRSSCPFSLRAGGYLLFHDIRTGSNRFKIRIAMSLMARVDAILRRTTSVESSLEAGGIVIDKTAHQVTIDGNPIELSVKEFELLSYFVTNRGVALSREKILNNVWNYDYFGDARTIDTHVKKLRSKLGEKGDYIKTIWGMGYKFEY